MSDLLLIEDDQELASLLTTSLAAFGHDVSVSHRMEGAVDLACTSPCDLLLIDLGLPDGDGIDAIRDIRAVAQLPIIVITGRDGLDARIAALDAGADDLLLKPFSADELAARVRAQLRRAAAPVDRPRVLTFDGLEVDIAAREVRRDGQRIHLTPTEMQMLILLASNPQQLVTHGQLYRRVWPDGSGESGHYVRVYIQQIRRKLGDDASNPTFIATEMSQGYRWLPRLLSETPST